MRGVGYWEGYTEIEHFKDYCAFDISDRYFWTSLDPQYVSEGVLSIGNVFTFAKGTYLFCLDKNLGTLQITLGLMFRVGSCIQDKLLCNASC